MQLLYLANLGTIILIQNSELRATKYLKLHYFCKTMFTETLNSNLLKYR